MCQQRCKRLKRLHRLEKGPKPGGQLDEFVRGFAGGKYRGIKLSLSLSGRCSKPNETQVTRAKDDAERLLQSAIVYLRKRFDGIEEDAVIKASAVFDPMTWPATADAGDSSEDDSHEVFGKEDVMVLARYYSNLLQASDMYDVQDERDEFFPMMVKHRTRTFEEVRKSAVTKWARFPYLARLVQIVATLPVNTAECECGFSAQNRIKTRLRNQLTS